MGIQVHSCIREVDRIVVRERGKSSEAGKIEAGREFMSLPEKGMKD